LRLDVSSAAFNAVELLLQLPQALVCDVRTLTRSADGKGFWRREVSTEDGKVDFVLSEDIFRALFHLLLFFLLPPDLLLPYFLLEFEVVAKSPPEHGEECHQGG